jgi:hypothetical protein
MRLLTFILLLAQTSLCAQQADPLLFKEKTHDFGEINEDGGKAEAEFSFTNNSGRAMKIISVQPSCGCTTPGWTKEAIAPGGTGFVKAIFDPKGRPGFFNKSLTVTTDLEGGPMVLQIKGQVLEKNHVVAAVDFPVEKGNLHFKLNAINLDKIFINLPASQKEFPVYNAGPKVIHFNGKIAGPSYIRIETPKELIPNEKGTIKVTFDAKMRGRYGFVSEDVEIATDDELMPIKSFPVYATIEDFFPVLSADESAKAPVLRMDLMTFDLGKIRQGSIIERDVGLRNVGKKDLIIRGVQPNCSCVTATVESMVIRSGVTANVKISFATAGRDGTQQKAVTFYTNDPKNPVQRITLTAYIEN